jgi:hypothetical protein
MVLTGSQRKGFGIDLALLAGWKGLQQILLLGNGVNKADHEAF